MMTPITAANNFNLLQPVSVNNNNQQQQGQAVPTSTAAAKANVGATWSGNLNAGDLKIDLDNLLTKKSNKSDAPALSMNALKVQSPTKGAGVSNVPQHQQQQSNFANFGGNSVSPLSSPAFFNMAPTNIPIVPQQTPMFANFSNNAVQTPISAVQQQQQQQKQQQSFHNNNLQTQSFDLFQ